MDRTVKWNEEEPLPPDDEPSLRILLVDTELRERNQEILLTCS